MKVAVFALVVSVLIFLVCPAYAQRNAHVLDSAAVEEYDLWAKDRRKANPGRRFKLVYSVLAGTKGSSLTAFSFDSKAFRLRWAPIVGGSVAIPVPGFSRKVCFVLEANYAHSYYLGTEAIVTSEKAIRTDYEFALSTMQFPLSLKMNFRSAGNAGFVKAGYALNLYRPGSLDWMEEIQIKNNIVTSVGSQPLYFDRRGALHIGAGYAHHFFRSMKLYAEVRFELAQDHLDYRVLQSESALRNVIILMGLEF